MSHTNTYLSGAVAVLVALLGLPQSTFAITCGAGSDIGGGQCRVFLTSGTSWSVPSDWNSSANTIEVIGGGGGATGFILSNPLSSGSGGGGGGAYSAKSNVTLSGTVGYAIGAGGNSSGSSGGDTYFCNSTSNCAAISESAVQVGAKGGTGATGISGGNGGSSGSGIGTTVRSGGNGGSGGGLNIDGAGAGGGGGAAGPSSAGANGGASLADLNSGGGGGGGANSTNNGADQSGGSGGAGGNGPGGSGGGSSNGGDGSNGGGGGGGNLAGAGGDGGSGTEWTTHGAGGGGGGAGNGSDAGGNGGSYGGGGGGGNGTNNGGTGGAGLIVITYTPSAGGAASTLSKPPNNLGLVGYWSFDEATSTTATDFSGNGKSGTLSTTGATLPNWVNGKRRSALEFDGADDYVSVGNVVSNVMTISLWIKADDTTSRKIMDIDGTDQIELDGSSQVTATSFPGTTAIYVDGSSASSVVGSGWHHVVITDTTGVSASTVDIGRVAGGYFDGNIDEVRMYSRILSIGEIESLRRLGAAKFSSSVELQRGSSLETGLVGHWTFDGADTQQTITDRSGEGNHGYYNGGATSSAYTIGKFGQALSFNSVSQYVSLPTYDSLRSTDGSVSAWVKTTVDNNGTIFSATHLCCAADGLDISIGGSVTAFCTNELISVNTDAAGARECYTTANRAELFDGNWHHIVVTTDSSTHIYLDGVAKIVTNGNGADPGTFTNIHGGMDEFSIGAYISTAGGDCCSVQGKLDDVRVYNRTLSANEVKQLYNLGRAVIRN